MIIRVGVDRCEKSIRNRAPPTSNTSPTGAGRTALTIETLREPSGVAPLANRPDDVPAFEHPLVVPRAPVGLGEVRTASPSRAVCVGCELVELDEQAVDAAEPVRLVEPVDQFVLAALDVDHHHVDLLDLEPGQDGAHIPQLELGGMPKTG